MRKIQVKIRRNIGQYKCVESWCNIYLVNDYTSHQGELIQFFKGGYTLFCLGKNDFRYIN